MVELLCAVVGVGSIFPVDIELSETVGDLKDKIKEEKPSWNHIPASQLKLYLAREDYTWLNSRDGEIQALKANRLPDRIKRLMQEHLVLDETARLDDDDYFRKEFIPGVRDIHVLEKLPSSEDEAWGITAATTQWIAQDVDRTIQKVLDETLGLSTVSS